jgi:hypothetical protein
MQTMGNQNQTFKTCKFYHRPGLLISEWKKRSTFTDHHLTGDSFDIRQQQALRPGVRIISSTNQRYSMRNLNWNFPVFEERKHLF